MNPPSKKTEESYAPGFLSTELANSITHGIGCGLSISALTLMVVAAARNGSTMQVVACSIYGTTLVVLYLASTLYHSIHVPRAKRILRIIDHASIYLLIAGTYTPFALVVLDGAWRWWVFGLAWGLAFLGIAFKVMFTGRLRILSELLYLAMGWLALLLIKPMLGTLPPAGIWWLGAGGVTYTLGVIFYVCKRIPHHHAIWHLFVMGGSACHFFAVMLYVLKVPA